MIITESQLLELAGLRQRSALRLHLRDERDPEALRSRIQRMAHARGRPGRRAGLRALRRRRDVAHIESVLR
jgi:hypothetical protein